MIAVPIRPVMISEICASDCAYMISAKTRMA
ncbi:hypothetical protein SAMN04490244_1092 [Tranquillimonas rosea]|uniref:Uncharacterized protein n=1 Tax=Tranquillimonas rosea TaxID=641238 RepID=A0A1H9W1K0_9RHOB|nr:hypothetical protein SAMN04490244_1092 [Tranquillimonas rosea]